MTAPATASVGEVLAIHGHGVCLILDQGLLDHWFTPDHWADIKPAPAAFDMAEEFGLVERHFTGKKFRLTNLGRHHRALRSAATPARAEVL